MWDHYFVKFPSRGAGRHPVGRAIVSNLLSARLFVLFVLFACGWPARFEGAFAQEVYRPYWLERVANNREGQRFTPSRDHYSAKVTSQGAVKCPSPPLAC